MHGLVVNVGAFTLCNVETIHLRFGRVPEMLLLVADVVLGASHDAGCLDALDGRRNQSARQVWIWRETFLESMSVSFLALPILD